jgi:hypothetical protein
MSSSDAEDPRVARVEAAALALAEAVDQVLAEELSGQISDAAVQRILTAGTRLFARKAEIERRDFSPFTSADAATATDAVTVMGGMLEAVNLSVFDLSMWVDGRPRG